jgi:hypothetical protein
MRSHDLPKTTVRSDDVRAGFELVQDGVTRDWYAVRKADRQELGRQHLLKSKKDLIRFIEDHASVRQRHGFPAGGAQTDPGLVPRLRI